MIAARLYGKNDLRVEQVQTPAISDEEILVKIKAAAVCGTDVRMLQNGGKFDSEHPLIPGHEFSGVIEAVGKNVEGYSAGMRVAVAPNIGCGYCEMCIRGDGHHCTKLRAMGVSMDGGFAEYIRVPKEAVLLGNVMDIGDISFEDAAINEALSCAYNGFERVSLRAGETFLVVGAGAIGLMHAKLAKMAGASKVFIHDLSKDRLDFAKKYDAFFTPVYGDLREAIMDGTNGKGCDAIVTACPVPAVQQQSLDLAALNGRINFFGGLPKDREQVPLNSNLIHYKQLIVSGTTRASLSHYAKTLGFIQSGILDIKALTSDRYALSDIETAFGRAAKAEGLKHVVVF